MMAVDLYLHGVEDKRLKDLCRMPKNFTHQMTSSRRIIRFNINLGKFRDLSIHLKK
jgi:hypothetical protein